MSYRIGIDAGSKTIKVVVMEEDGSIRYQAYRRHRSNIIQTLRELLHELQWMLGDIDGPVTFTGSAGIGIAEEVGAPFVQEVIATTAAVQAEYPQADAVIELGGEDAKVIYLTGGIEQRMNASCAGGTGGFIDTIAFMLGVKSSEMDHLAYGCRHVYPIASRCAVFAQTDIRPLINAGVPKADLAGSVFQAVVRQTLGGLACGRPLRGTIVFLGGPLEHNNSLVTMFRKELDLTKDTGIKPKDAHLFTVRGAAGFADEHAENALTLTELQARLETMDTLTDDLERLAPLFESEEEIREFKERHAACVYPQEMLFYARGPLYLGIDAGSTTVKMALIDEAGTLMYHHYAQTDGDTAQTLREMLLDMFEHMPRPFTKGGKPVAWIARAAVTGYGEQMIQNLFGVDSGVVETAAHLRAAKQVCPDVSFLLDIGGQDMKALWVKDGVITDAVLNEACSSGCGSFIEGTSYSLKSTPYAFAEMALTAESPVDLGTRCTVFMTSRVRHAQKIGAQIDDIAAGLAYSVVQNALYRIIGAERVASMGDHIVVQGGAFKSDAVLRAFELISGREVVRCNLAHLMGAIGAALTARDEAHEIQAKAATDPAGVAAGSYGAATDPTGVAAGSRGTATDFHGSSKKLKSTLASAKQIEGMQFKRKSITCSGCANACPLSMISASDSQAYVSGNRCNHGLQEFERQKAELVASLQNLNGKASDKSPFGNASSTGVSAERAGNDSNDGSLFGSVDLAQRRKQNEESFSDANNDSNKNANNDSIKDANFKAKILSPPSVIVREQELLSSYEGTTPGTCRADINIGIANAMEVFGTIPFWHAVLLSLGFTVTVDPSSASDVGMSAAWETIPSESVCYPAKLAHLRYFNLVQQGVNAVFMPQFERHSHCAVSSSYAQALADNLPAGSKPLIAPVLSSYKPHSIIESEDNIAVLRRALESCLDGEQVDLADDELRAALQAGITEQKKYDDQVKLATRNVLKWLAADSSRRGVVLAGRSYHSDAAVSKSIDVELQKLSVAVLSMRGLNAVLREDAPNENPEGSRQNDSAEEQGFHRWRPAKRLRSAADYVAIDPQLDLVCLQSFGCGYDAVSFDDVRPIVEAAQKPFTVLKIDDITDLAHIRIRLRTLVDAIKRRPVDADSGDSFDERADAGVEAHANAHVDSLSGTQVESQPESEAVTQESEEIVASKNGGMNAHTASFTDAVLDGDLNTIRQNTTKDVCFTAQTMAAQIIDEIKADPTIDTIELPLVCKDCLFDAVPIMVEHAVGKRLNTVWTDVTGMYRNCMQGFCDGSDNISSPRIGIVGNALMCYQPALNDNVIELLDSLGVEGVLPDPDLIQVEDVRYEDQLERFAQAGITEVLYLQSFGCLKGHIQSRGALHHLKKKFPQLNITVIDYDPEASALNRENRIRLVAEALKRNLAASR